MTTTEDTGSLVNRIIAELEARPEVKPALLRALLTDEFLLLPSKVDRLMDLIPAVETLQQDVSELKEGQARLEKRQDRLEEGQSRLQEGQVQLEERQDRLEEGQSRLQEGQARLEERQDRLEEGQARLEEGQARLTADVSELKTGQQRMGGELSNLSGSQFQRHVTEIGRRLVRRNMGFENVRLLHGDITFGQRMADDIAEEAENAGRITMDEGDALVMADIIFIAEDEAGQPVQVLLEVSLTVQQHDIERAETRARILERATGIRTLAGVVGESIPEEERTRAQGRGIACMATPSGRPPQ